MPNIQSTINAHNKKILEDEVELKRGPCNCSGENLINCPLPGECLTSNVLYEATISSNLRNYKDKIYKGITGTSFKERHRNHKKSFNHEKYKNESELSKEVWNIKRRKGNPKIKWRIIKQYPSYNPLNDKCELCRNEKLEILKNKGSNMLNKRSEIVSYCKHKANFMLKVFDVT